MKQQELAALEAVARRFSAGWQLDEESRGVWLAIGEKRIAIDITTMKHRNAGGADIAKPRLRFDKVAFRLVEQLQTALRDAVPPERTLIVTVTAPIRQAAKTAVMLEERMKAWLARPSTPEEIGNTIHGNETRARLVKNGSSAASRVIGFVHNRGTDPDVLFDLTRSLIDCIGAASVPREPAAGDRWLIIVNLDGLPHIGTYRDVYSQLSILNGFGQILMVFAGDRVEILSP